MGVIGAHSPHRLPRYNSALDTKPQMQRREEYSRIEQAQWASDKLKVLQGQDRSTTRNPTRMERLRDWSAHNPKLSKTAAIASIVALSTSLALVSGWAIDELAHLTDRKNDKVGLVFGAVVGIAMAITQTVQLFSLARRGEIGCKANAFSPDAHSMEGQSARIIRSRNPILWHSILNNARSEMAKQHDYLEFNHDDCFNAMNTCIKEGWRKNVWSRFFEVANHAPTDGRVYTRVARNAPSAEMTEGMYLVAKHRNPNHFLDSEATDLFSLKGKLTEPIIAAVEAKQAVRKATQDLQYANKRGSGKIQQLEDELKEKQNTADRLTRLAKRTLRDSHGLAPSDTESMAALEQIWEKQTACKGRSFDGLLDQLAALETHDVSAKDSTLAEISDESRILRNDLAARIDSIDGAPAGGKSWVRVDELQKVGMALEGLRPASLHSFIQNFRDSFFSFAGSMDARAQGRQAGNSIFSFVPFALLVSVVGVLCLGMSSTSPAGGADPNANTKDHKDYGLGVFPAFENGSQAGPAPVQHAAAQPQSAPAGYPTPMMQAMQVPNGTYSFGQ